MSFGKVVWRRRQRKDSASTEPPQLARPRRDERRREEQRRDDLSTPHKTLDSGARTTKPHTDSSVSGVPCATGERFVLSRTRRRRREHRTEPPSFVGDGARGRARYLFDSLLRLTRDRSVVLLLLVLALSYQLRMLLLHIADTVRPVIEAYRTHTDSQLAPFALLADSLSELARLWPLQQLRACCVVTAACLTRLSAHAYRALLRILVFPYFQDY
eukprot:IDg10116t1